MFHRNPAGSEEDPQEENPKEENPNRRKLFADWLEEDPAEEYPFSHRPFHRTFRTALAQGVDLQGFMIEFNVRI